MVKTIYEIRGMKGGIIKTEYATYWVEAGILNIIFPEDIVLNLDLAKEMVEDRIKITEGKTWPLLVDVSGLASVDTAARQYFATERGIHGVSSAAILAKSMISKLAANLFIKVNKPAVPTKLFIKREKAEVWIKKYVRLNEL